MKYDPVDQQLAEVFPTCTVTQVQSRCFNDLVNLQGTFLASIEDDKAILVSLNKDSTDMRLQLTHEQLVLA